ncbi:hypothetical protein Zmor_014400 [Zophobas morio]|uniref:Uncharacterized protein n=1 Tax=Zophobas morio TaxID=2755281 RepID=A0AA38IHQ9_9CUCU|nr:hypothetical protein Zmor_014400 [Zophobas morio]
MFCFTVVMLVSVFVECFSSLPAQNSEDFFIKRIVKECVTSNSQMSCFANKVAKTIERSMEWDVTLFDGIKLLRNNERIDNENESRSHLFGPSRLMKAVKIFLNTHYFALDLTEDESTNEPRGGGGGLGSGGGGGLGFNRQALKKEAKYMQYAFMVLLGIFGLTGPIVMKTLAVMAAKSLIASKMALIIVGSVALKKLFEKDHHEKTSVKVHTINTDDDHDRIYAPYKSSNYWSYAPYIKST